MSTFDTCLSLDIVQIAGYRVQDVRCKTQEGGGGKEGKTWKDAEQSTDSTVRHLQPSLTMQVKMNVFKDEAEREDGG